MSKVGIVMPVVNQFKLALSALSSVETQHNWKPFVIPNYELELALSGAWNLGCHRAINWGADYILVINDDILFGPRTIDELVDTFENPPIDNIVMVTGWNIRGQVDYAEDIYGWEGMEGLHGENPDFACFMIRPSTIDIVGNFDENFRPAYFEDNDYHRRINLSGHKAIFTTNAPYYHYGSRTQNADPDFPVVPPPAFEINKLYYIGKWGGEPDKESLTTPFGDPARTWRDW